MAPPGTPGAATIREGPRRQIQSGDHRDGQGTGRDLHHRARQVDRGAQRDDERCQFGTHAEPQRAFERHGDRRRGGLRAEGRDVGGEHRAQHPQRVSPGREPRHRELEDEQHEGQRENHDDEFHEDSHHGGHLPRLRDREEDAEDVERQQRDDDPHDHQFDDAFEVVEGGFQRHGVGVGHAEPEDEGEDQRRHHAHDGRHFDGEVGGLGSALFGDGGLCSGEQRREEGPSGEEGPESGDQREAVGQRCGQGQQPSGAAPEVGDTGRHQSEDQQRDDEFQKLPENGVERQRHAGHPSGRETAAGDAQPDGQEDARQKTEFSLHRRTIFVKVRKN